MYNYWINEITSFKAFHSRSYTFYAQSCPLQIRHFWSNCSDWFHNGPGGVEKRDINLEYQTPGDGNAYAIDGNDEYQPSDNDEVEERNDGVRTQRFTPPKVGMLWWNVVNWDLNRQGQQAKRWSCVCLTIFCLTLVAVGLAAYFLTSSKSVTNTPSASDHNDFTWSQCSPCSHHRAEFDCWGGRVCWKPTGWVWGGRRT